jgi:hypothetical protein
MRAQKSQRTLWARVSGDRKQKGFGSQLPIAYASTFMEEE